MEDQPVMSLRIIIVDDHFAFMIKQAILDELKARRSLRFRFDYELLRDQPPEKARDHLLELYRQKGAPFVYIQDCHYNVEVPGVPVETAGLRVVLEGVCSYYRVFGIKNPQPWTHVLLASRYFGPIETGPQRDQVHSETGPNGRYRVPYDHRVPVSENQRDNETRRLAQTVVDLAERHCADQLSRCECLNMPALYSPPRPVTSPA